MTTTIEKRLKALESLIAVENKIKSLHVIDYGDYYTQYIKAFIAYESIGFEDYQITPFGLECLKHEAQDEYYNFIEGLECKGYCIRW